MPLMMNILSQKFWSVLMRGKMAACKAPPLPLIGWGRGEEGPTNTRGRVGPMSAPCEGADATDQIKMCVCQ